MDDGLDEIRYLVLAFGAHARLRFKETLHVIHKLLMMEFGLGRCTEEGLALHRAHSL